MDRNDGGPSATRVFRKRDFAFLVILVLAIYISLDTTSFTYRLQPAWYFDQRGSGDHDWPQLSPLVVDLDGDDRNEIVFITKDQFLKVLRAEASDELTEDIYAPLEIASTPLSNALGKVTARGSFCTYHLLMIHLT